MNNLQTAIDELNNERAMLDEGIRILTNLKSSRNGLEPPTQPVAARLGRPPGKRHLSAAARKKISLAAKRRWALVRKAA